MSGSKCKLVAVAQVDFLQDRGVKMQVWRDNHVTKEANLKSVGFVAAVR